jgi:hypothetical protein
MVSIREGVLWKGKMQRIYEINLSSGVVVSWWVCGF